jgi:EthD domain
VIVARGGCWRLDPEHRTYPLLITLGFYKRKPGLSVEEFQRIWSTVYGPLYGKSPELTRFLRRYVQHRLTPQTDWPTTFVGFDGFSESWFATVEDLENSKFAAYDSQVYQVGDPPTLFQLQVGGPFIRDKRGFISAGRCDK